MAYTHQTEQERADLGKPDCELVGQDGNAFAIMGRVSKALKRAGYSSEAVGEYMDDSMSGDYTHLLSVAMDWVEDIGEDVEYDDDEEDH